MTEAQPGERNSDSPSSLLAFRRLVPIIWWILREKKQRSAFPGRMYFAYSILVKKMTVSGIVHCEMQKIDRGTVVPSFALPRPF